MKVYQGTDIRNVAVVGHAHSGKTSLVSALLFTSGATPRMGRVDEGTTVTDYDEEEVARQMTVSTGVAHVEWGGKKINLLDTPGFNMFVHEAKAAMVAAECALVTVDGVSGVEVITERVWGYAEELELPRIIVGSRMDRERASMERMLESVTTAFGRQVIPVQLPIGAEKSLGGVVDLVRMKAYSYELGGNGKGKEIDIPGNLAEAAKEGHEKIVELVAEGNDELMQEFFDTGTIPVEHLIPGLHDAIRDHRIFPLLFASGLGNIGTDQLLNFLVEFAPAASDHAPVKEVGKPDGNATEHKISDSESLSMYVFKTISDPFAGHISFFKVF